MTTDLGDTLEVAAHYCIFPDVHIRCNTMPSGMATPCLVDVMRPSELLNTTHVCSPGQALPMVRVKGSSIYSILLPMVNTHADGAGQFQRCLGSMRVHQDCAQMHLSAGVYVNHCA